MSFLYRLAVTVCWGYANIFCKVNIKGLENIPKEGAVILISNHISYFDPFLVAKNINRQIRFIATEEFFKNPLSAFFMRAWRCIPIKRNSADTSAIKESLRLLKDGNIIGLFPQGGIVKDGKKDEFQAGVAMLVAKSGKSVLPVSVSGSRHLYHPFSGKGKDICIEYKQLFSVDTCTNELGFASNTDKSSAKDIRANILKIIESKTRQINQVEHA